MTSFQKK